MMGDHSPAKSTATLSLDDREVELNHFAEAALVGIIEGYLSALRDVGPGEVVIRIPAGRRPDSV
jgi:hypothetical protein